MAEPTEGVYYILSVGSQKCIDVKGDSDKAKMNVLQYSKNNSDAQIWAFDKQSNGWQILCSLTGKCLDIAGSIVAGTNVQQYSDSNKKANQRWTVATDGKTATYGGKSYNSYTIKPKTNGNFAIGVKSNSSANNSNIEIQSASSSSNYQRWLLIPAPVFKDKGTYNIVCASDVKKEIAISGASTANSANAVVASRSSALSHIFRTSVNAESFITTFFNAKSGKVLDVKSSSPKSGTNVIQYKHDSSNAQQHFLPVKIGAVKINGATYPTYQLRAQVGTNLCLAVSKGNLVVQTRNDSTKAQRFAFVKTEFTGNDIAVPGAINKTLFKRNGPGSISTSNLQFSSKATRFQARYMIRYYKKGRKVSSTTNYMNLKDRSKSNEGWGSAWSHTFKASPKLGLITIPASLNKKVTLNKTDKVAADIVVQIRSYTDSYKKGFNAHSSVKQTIIKMRQVPTISLKSVALSIGDNAIGVVATLSDSLDEGCVNLRGRILGSDNNPITKWRSVSSMSIEFNLGGSLYRLPDENEKLTLEYVLLIKDGITLQGSLAKNFSYGTLTTMTAPTFRYRNDGSFSVEIMSSKHKYDVCVMEIESVEGKKYIRCPRISKEEAANRDWLCIPPLNTSVNIMVFGYRNSSESYYASKALTVKSHSFIWNWTDNSKYQYASILVNKDNPPDQSRKFTTTTSFQSPAGRIWPVAFASKQLSADLSVNGILLDQNANYQAAGPIPPHCDEQNIMKLITLSGRGIHPIYRTPYGDRYKVAVESVDLSRSEMNVINVSVTQRAVED